MEIPWEKNFASAEIQNLDLSTHCYLEVSLKIAVGPPSNFTLVGPELTVSSRATTFNLVQPGPPLS